MGREQTQDTAQNDTFRMRTKKAWDAFLQGEAELRALMEVKDRAAVEERLMDQCFRMLHLAFEQIAFELGHNGEKYELILSPEGDKVRLFALVYFGMHAPDAVLEHWDIRVGRQPAVAFGLHFGGWEFTADDVQVWTDVQEDGRVTLTLYCERLLTLLKEEEDQAYWLLGLLLDQILGEVAAMARVAGFEVTDTRRAEQGVPLSRLPAALERQGVTLPLDPMEFLESSYTAYQTEPQENPDAGCRADVFAGSTNCVRLVQEYRNGRSGSAEALQRDGIAAGALFYPIEGFTGKERGRKILEFRDALEAAILREAGEDVIRFIGGASGLRFAYLDLLAWDLPAALAAAKRILEAGPLPWAGFHSFCRGEDVLVLLDRP